MNPIDKHTGRPVGDHGTAMELIAFAIDNARCSSEYYEILTAWRDGRMSDEWPEFYETLAPPVVATRVTLPFVARLWLMTTTPLAIIGVASIATQILIIFGWIKL